MYVYKYRSKLWLIYHLKTANTADFSMQLMAHIIPDEVNRISPHPPPPFNGHQSEKASFPVRVNNKTMIIN